jgi:ATP-binding cassette subfamily E protein 1
VGINEFLKEVNITFRRDEETRRLRANKPDSVKDREQKSSGIYFEK